MELIIIMSMIHFAFTLFSKSSKTFRVLIFLQPLLRYACFILYFYFIVVVVALTSFPDAVSIILRQKHAVSLSITHWKGGKSWWWISDIVLGRPDADASAAPLIKPAHVHLWEVAAFWLCHLPHQHHFQAPAMHLSVAGGVQREQAPEGHGAAPCPLTVTRSAGNVLGAGPAAPAQPQG